MQAKHRAEQAHDWAVIVVHGVGPTKPGDTVDDFCSTINDEVRIAPLRSTEYLSKKGGSEGAVRRRERDFFPVSMRRSVDGRGLLAELYWADLSKASGTTLGSIASYLTIVFHMRYLIDVAATYYADEDGASLWSPTSWLPFLLRMTLWACSFMLCGPLAATYLFALWISFVPFVQTPFTASVALLLLLIVLGVCAKRHRIPLHSGTWQLLLTWLWFWAFSGILYPILQYDDVVIGKGTGLLELRDWLLDPVGRWMMTAAVASMSAAVLISVAELLIRTVRGKRRAPVVAAIGGGVVQLAVWSIAVPLLGHLLFPDKGYDKLLATHLAAVAPAAIWLGCVLAARMVRPLTFQKTRLLVNELAVLLLVLGIALACVSYLDITIPSALEELAIWQWAVTQWSWWFALATNWSVRVVGLIGIALPISWFLPGASGSITHVVTDVVNHFYRKGIFLFPIQIKNGKPTTKLNPAVDFTLQDQILKRFDRVTQLVLDANPNIRRLTYVAHSQGTMHAILGLYGLHPNRPNQDDLSRELRRRITEIDVRIITMGSPFTHLYQHYFPARYPPVSEWNEWDNWFTATFRSWTNVYRPDDYVGTWINEYQQMPVNVPLERPDGHVNYWRERDILTDEVLRLLPWN